MKEDTYNQMLLSLSQVMGIELLSNQPPRELPGTYINGILDKEVLREKWVLNIGAGSVGSAVAFSLLLSHVRNFMIVDPDVIEGKNFGFSLFPWSSKHRIKALALKDLMQGVNPGANVEAYPERWGDLLPEEQRGLVKKADIIVAAFDDMEDLFLLNELAYRERKECLWVGVHQGVRSGHVFLTEPWQGLF